MDVSSQRAVISRRAAVAAGLAEYFTGKPCKRGHIDFRSVKCATCLSCRKLTADNWRLLHADAILEKDRARYTGERRQKQIKTATEWVAENRSRYKENAKASYERHKERRRARNREYASLTKDIAAERIKAWRCANRGRVAAIEAERRARKLLATPKWANLDEIKRIYQSCPPGHHIDHVIPLKGKNVCGLHCESNLRAIPAVENLKKGNRLPLEFEL